jgi:putative ABC transport system substrate-binding protein
MKRRELITLLGGAAAAWPFATRAQQPAMPVVGVMSPLSAATAARNLAALRNGLRDLGYNEGRNIMIEYRFADGAPERYPALMAELIALNPVLIVVGSTPAIVAASKVTRTTPLVWVGVADNPVALGLVGSFAHPGGNITGFLMSGDAGIVGKRLELLREAAPRFSRVGVLVAPDYAAEIIGRVASLRLPAMYFFREFVQSGGLLPYGSDLPDMYRRAGVYIDKILKGASPSELPVQSAEKFELAVNLKTAKTLGLAISESFLLRADEVIE